MVRRLAVLLFLLLALVGCDRGPHADQVQRDLTTQLTKAFDTGTFDIVRVVGRGSSLDITSPPGVDRRIVYYDAELRLTRDLDFGGWNTPGVASLVTVFGAGPKGVRGAKSGGNQAGDMISAHGTAIYRRDGQAWQIVVPAGFAAPVAPTLDAISQPSTSDRFLTALQNVVRAYPVGTTSAARAVIDQELSRALTTIQAQLTRLAQGYPIAAGPEGGQYVRLVQALQTTKPMGLNFQALLTEGSIENLTLLRQEKVLFAMTQSDIAQQAATGAGSFSAQGPFTGLRALGSLYPEPLHIIVRADSPAKAVRDLMHKRIGLGPGGSGTRATAERVLSAHGMTAGVDYTLDESSFPSALTAIESGALDAVMQVIGMPADQIRTATASVPLRLLPIDETVLADLTGKDPAILRGVIPKATYPGVEDDVPTLAVAALLTTNAALSDAEARALISAIFGKTEDLLAAGSAQAGQINAQTARMGVAIPFLPAADAALSELSVRR